MSVVDRNEEKLELPRRGPDDLDHRLAQWCQDPTVVPAIRRNRWLAWATVLLLAAGWSLQWIRQALGPSHLRQLLPWSEFAQQPIPVPVAQPSPVLQQLADWIKELQPARYRRQLLRYWVCQTLRTADWYLEWIGSVVGHPKGHLPRLLRRFGALVREQLPGLRQGTPEVSE